MNQQKQFLKFNKNKQAFTLVELIVVVTILAILSTIGFVSYSSYLTWVRDTNRVSNMKAISDWLELYGTKFSLPLPEDSVDIKENGTIIAYQWYAWANVLESIEFSNRWKDPKNDFYYSYYLTKDKKYFQLMWFLEEEDNLQIVWIFNETQAVDYSILHPTVYGKKLGILTDSSNMPLQENSVISWSWYIDVLDVWNIEIKSHLRDWENVSWTWTIFLDLMNIANVWWKLWWVFENRFVYLGEWTGVDLNCDIDDITIWSQIWAWCNSTLWIGIEFVSSNVDSCRNYSWSNISTCSDAENLSNIKENTWNSTSWINNIWWKIYLWDNAAGACSYWRRVPTDEDFYNLEVVLWSTDRSTDWTYAWILDGWKSDWLGWNNHTNKNSTNNIIEALRLPLAGDRYSDGVTYGRGHFTDLWSSTAPDSLNYYARTFYYFYSTILRQTISKDAGLSVRCIRD